MVPGGNELARLPPRAPQPAPGARSCRSTSMPAEAATTKESAGGEDSQAMVAGEEPRHHAPYAGSGPKMLAALTARPHKPKNSARRAGGAEHSRPWRGLRPAPSRPHNPARFAAIPEAGQLVCRRSREGNHRRPSSYERDRDGARAADRVLHVAEAEGADCSGHVHHQDQRDGLLHAELHDLLGVDRGERNHRGDRPPGSNMPQSRNWRRSR